MLLVPSVEVTKGEPRPLGPDHIPSEDDGRRIGGSNAESSEQFCRFGAESNIGALLSSIGGRRLYDFVDGNMR